MAVEERLQPSGGTAADERFIKSAEAVYRGGYDELRDMADGFRQFDPMDDTPGFVVNTWRLEREPGGLATLRVYGVPESASTWAGETRSTNPFYDAWSVKTVRVDVSAMAYCGTAKNNPQRALVEKWLAETDRGAASRRTFMENGAEYDMEEKAPPTYELIGKMQAGKESVMRFHPVVTRRRHYRKPPQDAMDKTGFIDDPPKPDGEAAAPGTLSNKLQKYQWLKTQDDCDQQADGTWMRTESWWGLLKTSRNQTPWDADLYGENRWDMPYEHDGGAQ